MVKTGIEKKCINIKSIIEIFIEIMNKMEQNANEKHFLPFFFFLLRVLIILEWTVRRRHDSGLYNGHIDFILWCFTATLAMLKALMNCVKCLIVG